ncbi:MAG: zinc-binding dehydrogenase [Armatimonadia bacterium]|nr:zinc-binding dehydrogenase [Armatimonadia bacterium]
MKTIGIEYTSPGEAELIELGPPPEPAPTQILIETQFSGVTNGTERHSLMGEHGWSGVFPSRNGYQHVAVVRSVGADVAGFSVGDRVFFGQYVGHRGWNVVDVATDGGRSLCVKLPADGDGSDYALLGVAGVAMRGVRRMRVGPGSRVWVAGLGPIGQFAAQSASVAGAHVTVTDPNPKRLAVAAETCADLVVDPRDQLVPEDIKAAGPFSHIIDCCGVPSLLTEIGAAGIIAHRGVVGLLAVRSDTTFPWGMMHGTEASIEVSCHFDCDDLRVLLQLMGQGRVRTRPLVTHAVPIEDAVRIYEGLRDNPSGYLGIVFDWTG